ncbi:MAG: tRNA dihydrouridine synthase DusB [Rhizobiaceae bacterium]
MPEDCLKFTHPSVDIGPMTLRNRAVLAPMSGVSDVPFRRLAWEFGAGMVVSEMVASEALTTGQEEMRLKAESAGLPVHIVQLAGRQASWMSEATRMAEQAGANAIDINMGCPSKRVTTGYSGSALMRDLDHAMTLIDAVLSATRLPVTLKMRLGWDESAINAPELAERAERAGVQMITVHGRTRNQFYKGKADWTKVRAVREKIKVPLIVNGDIVDVASARAALAESGADGVMIGRGSYGAPWLPGQIGAALDGETLPIAPVGKELAGIVSSHYEEILSFYGFELGLRNARKHLDWYSAGLSSHQDYKTLRRQLMTSQKPNEVHALLDLIFALDSPQRAVA